MTIPVDKQEHFGLSLLGAFVMGLNPFVAPWVAALFGSWAASQIGILKECFDKRHPLTHTMDADDAFASSLGGVVGGILSALFRIYMLKN